MIFTLFQKCLDLKTLRNSHLLLNKFYELVGFCTVSLYFFVFWGKYCLDILRQPMHYDFLSCVWYLYQNPYTAMHVTLSYEDNNCIEVTCVLITLFVLNIICKK